MSPSGALVFKVGLFDASAEGQQVAVALDPLGQLRAGQPGGQYGEKVTKH